MSYDTILIHRDIPIIDKHMAMPPNTPIDNIDTDPDNFVNGTSHYIVGLSAGSGRQTGNKFGQQQFVRLVGINPDGWYSSDPLA